MMSGSSQHHVRNGDVRTIVAHVILGEAMLVDLLKGGVIEPLTDIDVSILGPNPIATWRGTAVAAIDAASQQEVEPKNMNTY